MDLKFEVSTHEVPFEWYVFQLPGGVFSQFWFENLIIQKVGALFVRNLVFPFTFI